MLGRNLHQRRVNNFKLLRFKQARATEQTYSVEMCGHQNTEGDWHALRAAELLHLHAGGVRSATRTLLLLLDAHGMRIRGHQIHTLALQRLLEKRIDV